eukprot:3173564-Pleurochrysis_carterae.AAC.1
MLEVRLSVFSTSEEQLLREKRRIRIYTMERNCFWQGTMRPETDRRTQARQPCSSCQPLRGWELAQLPPVLPVAVYETEAHTRAWSQQGGLEVKQGGGKTKRPARPNLET